MNWVLGRKDSSGFSSSSTAEEVTQGIDATGLTAIVTGVPYLLLSVLGVNSSLDNLFFDGRTYRDILLSGASSGIGTETARVLALRGAHVIIAVRNVEAGTAVKEVIIKENNNARVDVLELDLSSMASVRNFASNFKSLNLPLNILINNAGVMGCPFQLSQDGIELQFATNHIGHFLLTNLLLENMKFTAHETGIEGRIINVSSVGHMITYWSGIRFDKINDKSRYYAYLAYGQSKLANILHANELARRLKEEDANVTANSLHPGAIPTKLQQYSKTIFGIVGTLAKFAFKNVPQGAATTCYVALHPQLKGIRGKYFVDSNEATPSSLARDPELAKKLWEFSESITS